MQHVAIGAVDHAHMDVGPLVHQPVDRLRQHMAAGKRHGADDEAPGIAARHFSDFRKAVLDLDKSEARLLRKELRGPREFDAVGRRLEHRQAGQPFQLLGGAMHRGLRQADIARRHAEIASSGNRDQRAQLRDSEQPVEFGRGAAAPGGARDIAGARAQKVERRGGAGAKELAGGRGGHALWPVLEQRCAEAGFQLVDRLGNGGLRQVNALGRAADAARLGDHAYGAQMAQVRYVGLVALGHSGAFLPHPL